MIRILNILLMCSNAEIPRFYSKFSKYVMHDSNIYLVVSFCFCALIQVLMLCVKSNVRNQKNYISFSNHGDDAECAIPGVGVVVGAGSIHCAVH